MARSLAAEAMRLHQRYMVEFVEQLALCPWAKEARERGQVRHHVCLEASPDAAVLSDACRAWRDDDDAVVAFVLLPLYRGVRDGFDRWVDTLRNTELADTFAMAAFFPQRPEDGDDLSVVELLRQSPDPTVQLVRHAALEEIRSGDTPKYADVFRLNLQDLEAPRPAQTVYDAVFARNRDRVIASGQGSLRAVIESIRADRDRTYAGLLPSLR